jgi:hypothetical protein
MAYVTKVVNNYFSSIWNPLVLFFSATQKLVEIGKVINLGLKEYVHTIHDCTSCTLAGNPFIYIKEKPPWGL